jgi:hypothetical protein
VEGLVAQHVLLSCRACLGANSCSNSRLRHVRPHTRPSPLPPSLFSFLLQVCDLGGGEAGRALQVDWRGPRPRRNRHQAKRALGSSPQGRCPADLRAAVPMRQPVQQQQLQHRLPAAVLLSLSKLRLLLFCCNECRCLVSAQAAPSTLLPLPIPATSSFFPHCESVSGAPGARAH